MTKEAFCDELDRLIAAGANAFGAQRVTELAKIMSDRAEETGHTIREVAIASAINLRAVIAAADEAAEVGAGNEARS